MFYNLLLHKDNFMNYKRCNVEISSINDIKSLNVEIYTYPFPLTNDYS